MSILLPFIALLLIKIILITNTYGAFYVSGTAIKYFIFSPLKNTYKVETIMFLTYR